MKKITLMLSIMFLVSATSLVQAQSRMGSSPQFYSEFKPVVGCWSEYQMTNKGASPQKMKIAVVGKEGNDYWYETVMELGDGESIISKNLISGDPSDTKNIKKMIVKSGTEPAMEMPGKITGMSRQGSQIPQGKLVEKGTEKVTVPAGTFTTRHIQRQFNDYVVDAWVCKDVLPYGTVKITTKNSEMVLLGSGTGAKTRLTETPQKFTMPGESEEE
jgi:hypothetical protein